ncbi:Cof-type HAD-IIB family hydrolase [Alkalibacter saccharofermentans]|uniref:Cof subfamily of IIB subfamily of haloacid dehalogenase superfamily/HAD-superfamily hydrolase, subfamily IIB n=1 Tax=Alkalibacter saccharofermentans DSM 14828 TaxID=1120975 RepID=A0A1M4WE68_9FIRM|nr:HAD family hydrolase [Alkalibacter saccharofermentans]SHE79262.1 hypothetical protein SAMN02746064_01202 [Alkalibacter saccharofermentans DSM 14828]
MKYKMIAIDMDGTLLDNNQLISDENIEALHAAKNNGYKIVFATGRVLESAMAYSAAINLDNDYVCCMGAIMKYSNVIKKHAMNKDLIIKYADLCQANGANYGIVTDDNIYYFNNDQFYYNYYSDNKMIMYKNILSKSTFSDIHEIENKLESSSVLKMELYETGNDVLSKIWPKLDHDLMCIVRANYLCIEIVSPYANKGSGLSLIANHYGLGCEEIIAIGDSDNDIPMFEVSGLSVSMENSPDDIKSITHYTTDSNDNAGVAKILKKLKII